MSDAVQIDNAGGPATLSNVVDVTDHMSATRAKAPESPMYEDRPWGSFTVLTDEETHKVKSITVTPGQRLSYQRHSHRSEHWFVISGDATVTLDGVVVLHGGHHEQSPPAGTGPGLRRTHRVPQSAMHRKTKNGTWVGNGFMVRCAR